MLDVLIWNKFGRIVRLLAERLNISDKTALTLFYNSRVYQVLSDKECLLITQSDEFILDELLNEI